MALSMSLVMIVLLLLGFPMMVPLLAATLVGFAFFFSDLPPEIIVQQMIGGVRPAALIAVPMFILAADIMTRGHAAERLLDLVMKFVGHVRGGLPITTAVACTLFGAVSGSTQATVVAIGVPLRPRMIEAGYSPTFATALIINASDLALLIPPSIGMIVYGVVSGTSIGELFIAGVGPAIMILLFFCAYCYYKSIKLGVEPLPKASWGERLTAVRAAAFPLVFPVIIIGGIYAGFFSPTEAAVVSVFYALLVETVVFRSISFKELPDIFLSTGLITSVVFILVGAGAAFSWLISFAKLPEILINNTLGLTAQSSDLKILVSLLLAYFVGCMFVDPIVVILILTPIFHPIATAAGLDPVFIGILVTLQVAIGSATPPFGCDIFTAIAAFKQPYLEVIRDTPPFIAILVFSNILMLIFPQITLFLRDLAFGS